jgi:hypothetical protein
VNGKFDLAERQGWAVAEAVTTAELATTLDTSSGGGSAICKIDGGDTVAIVLVNQNVMVGKSDAVYTGHYVVAVGFVRCHDTAAFTPHNGRCCRSNKLRQLLACMQRLPLLNFHGYEQLNFPRAYWCKFGFVVRGYFALAGQGG